MEKWYALGVLIIGTLGCQEAPAEVPATPAPTDHVAQVRQSLHDARVAWNDGKSKESHQLVQRAYVESFEPLEPLLREQDASATLQLEYAFGRLMALITERRPDSVRVISQFDLVEQDLARTAAPVLVQPTE